MLIFDHVSKVYPGKVRAVDNFNLEVKDGEFVTLIGPSGCGKTTTLKMVNRLIEPTAGTIRINGKDISTLDPVSLRRNIGYVIQQIGLLPNMTIAQNISIVLKLLGRSKKECLRRAEKLLDMVDMDPATYMYRYPRELSGGQQQRIGVLRALAAEPEIILMDEPFGSLDPITREQLQVELKKLQEKLNKMIIFVTHDMEEALKLSDRIVLMRQGKIVQVATPDEMLRNPADDFVTSFIGKDRLLRSPDEVLVEEVMNKNPVTIGMKRGLAEALERMRKYQVDSLLVVENDGILQGVVTIKSIHKNLNKKTVVGDLLFKKPVTVQLGQTVREAVHIMAENKLGHLPVVNEEGKLKGLMTRSSLVDILSDVLWPSANSETNNNGNNTAGKVRQSTND